MAGGGDGGDVGGGGGFGDGGDSGTGGYGDSGSPYGDTGDTGYGSPADTMGLGGQDAFTPYTDPGSTSGAQAAAYQPPPQVGAPQSQQGPGGQPPGAVGGTQSGPQGAGQLGPMVQKAIQQLQSGGQQSGQPSGGGNLSPTLAQLSQTTQTALQPQGPPAGQGFGGGSPTAEATNQTQLMAQPVPTTSVAPGQQPTAQIPGSVPAAGPGQQTFPPGSQPATGGPPAGQGYGGGQTGGAAAPGEEAQNISGTTQRDANVPAPEAPKTGQTADQAADQAAQPPGGGRRGGGGGGQPSAGGQGGQPGAGGGRGAGQMNPMKFVGDILQALGGNPGPLLSDLAGQQQGQQLGYNPTTGRPYSSGARAPGATSSTGATAPTTGSNELMAKPGGPNNPNVDPNDPQSLRRQQWYQTHDRTDPFPEDTYVPQGPTQQGGTLADQAAGTTRAGSPTFNQQTNQQIKNAPAGSMRNNFNQPYNSNLATSRQRLMREYDSNPGLQRKIWAIGGNEQGNNPQGVQGVLETLVNRADVSGHSLAQEARWKTEGGYYDDRTSRRGAGTNSALGRQAMENIRRGGNISNYATDNSSGTYGRGQLRQGTFRLQSEYGGEYLQTPGTSGNFPRSQWQHWQQRMNSGATPGPQSSTQPNQQTASANTGDVNRPSPPGEIPGYRQGRGVIEGSDPNTPWQGGDMNEEWPVAPPGTRVPDQRGLDRNVVISQNNLASRYGLDWV
jgi:hypothetical protein